MGCLSVFLVGREQDGLVDLIWSTNYSSLKTTIFTINMTFKQFQAVSFKTEYGIGFPIYENLQKHISFKFLPCLVHKIYTFQPGGGSHLGFLTFEALSAIFELGRQQILVQHPSIPLKTMSALN